MERCGFVLLIQKKEKRERGRKGGRRKKGGKEPGKEEKKDGQYSYIERMEKTLSDTKKQLSIYPLNAIYYI